VLRDWEGNRRSCITPAVCRRICGVSPFWLDDLRTADDRGTNYHFTLANIGWFYHDELKCSDGVRCQFDDVDKRNVHKSV